MDTWKFYAITHRHHVVMNPTGEEKLMRLIELLRLPAKASVIDIASGKGDFLIRLANAYGARGLGIDISPYFIAEAQEMVQRRAPGAPVTFRQMNGADYVPEKPHAFQLASCLGASWIFAGHAGTLDALIRLVEPGGWVLAGEPFWRRDPSDAYLQASGIGKDDFGTHASNVEVGEQRGLHLVHTFVSNQDEWDRYEGLQWYAADEYRRTHPDDPDVPEVIERIEKEKATYLRWGRDTLGWAIYLFRRG